MSTDNTYMGIMQKEAELDAFGPKSEQCPVCSGPTGRLPWQTKEGLFEQTYGYHYACAKDASAPCFTEFERDYGKMQEVHSKKTGKPEPVSKVQTAVRRRLDELNRAKQAAGPATQQPISEEDKEKAAAAPPTAPAEAAQPGAPTKEAPAEAPAEESSDAQTGDQDKQEVTPADVGDVQDVLDTPPTAEENKAEEDKE